jgi:hypothetical protein
MVEVLVIPLPDYVGWSLRVVWEGMRSWNRSWGRGWGGGGGMVIKGVWILVRRNRKNRRNRREIRDRYDIWHTVCMNNLSFKTYVFSSFCSLFFFSCSISLILLDFFSGRVWCFSFIFHFLVPLIFFFLFLFLFPMCCFCCILSFLSLCILIFFFES